MKNWPEILDVFDYMALSAVMEATTYLRSCKGAFDSEHVWEYAEIDLEKSCRISTWLCKQNDVTAEELFSKSYKRIGKYIGKVN